MCTSSILKPIVKITRALTGVSKPKPPPISTQAKDDEEEKDRLQKEMMAEEMNFFTFQIIDSLADSYRKSVGDDKIAQKIKDFVDNPYFDKVLTESNFLKQKTNDDLKVGDVLLFEGQKDSLSHVALYIGDMMILNHSIRALSCRELFGLKYQKTLRGVYRYEA